MRTRKEKPMTISEFNEEWDTLRNCYDGQHGWYKYVLENFDILSDRAQRFIADDTRIFFGDWLKQKAIHRIFELDVLGGKKRK